MSTYKPTVLTFEGEIIGDTKFVMLEPKKWIGKSFPILNYLDINENLAVGKWITVFYYKDCPTCRELLAKITKLLYGIRGRLDNINIIFIEIPPYNDQKRRIIFIVNSSGQD